MQASPLKAFAAALTVALGAAPALAQTTTTPAEKKAAVPAAKPAASGNRLARSAQKAVEEATPIDDDPSIQLSATDLEVAKQVFIGDIPCELGASVKVTAARRSGLFVVSTKGFRFLMHPVESRTGAIRLEDGKRGAMWLQLGNKSMLMSQKLGRRLADECQSPQQVTFAEELKRNPRPSILDKPADAAVPPAAAAPTDTAPAAAAPEAAPSTTPAVPAAAPGAAPSTNN